MQVSSIFTKLVSFRISENLPLLTVIYNVVAVSGFPLRGSSTKLIRPRSNS